MGKNKFGLIFNTITPTIINRAARLGFNHTNWYGVRL